MNYLAIENTRKYADILNVDPEQYDLEVTLNDVDTRAYNVLFRCGLSNVRQLLLISPDELFQIRGVGHHSAQQIEDFIERVIKNDSAEKKQKEKGRYYSISSVLDYVKSGDFSFLHDDSEDTEFTERHHFAIEQYKETEELLGRDLIRSIMSDDGYSLIIINSLHNYIKNTERRHRLETELDFIPKYRLERDVEAYLGTFCAIKDIDIDIDNYKSYKVKDFILSSVNDDIYKTAIEFTKWISFDISEEWDSFFENTKMAKNANLKFILEKRAEGLTLGEVGDLIGCTRERIRQLEVKAGVIFGSWSRVSQLMNQMACELDSMNFIDINDVYKVLHRNVTILAYLCKNRELNGFSYDKTFGFFIRNWNETLSLSLSNAIGTLPKICERNSAIGQVMENIDRLAISKELVEAVLDKQLVYNDGHYFKDKINISDKYSFIMQKFYPNGLHVYDNDVIAEFKSYYGMYFDNDTISYRSFAGAMQRIGILCGRGSYKLRQEKYISDSLMTAIEEHISSAEQAILVVEDIYNTFERELLEEGVDNKYFLMGILQQWFGDKYRIRRNFLFKDPYALSIYDEVSRFIKGSDMPVNADDIKFAIPGINDIYISWAIAADEKILSLFGNYYHADNLNLSGNEVDWLHSKIETVLADNKTHHCKEIYDICLAEDSNVLTKNYVLYPYSFFSLIAYLFADEYQFVRPCISHIGVELEHTSTMFRNAINEYEELSIEQIRDIASDCHHLIYSMLDTLNDFNDRYYIADADTLMLIEKTGITEEIARKVVGLVEQEVEKTTVIKELNCMLILPEIRIPWSDWLVYSVLYKWSDKLSVGSTYKYFKQAKPVVSPKGEIDITQIDSESLTDSNSSDFDYDLDDLLADEAEMELDNEF